MTKRRIELRISTHDVSEVRKCGCQCLNTVRVSEGCPLSLLTTPRRVESQQCAALRQELFVLHLYSHRVTSADTVRDDATYCYHTRGGAMTLHTLSSLFSNIK